MDLASPALGAIRRTTAVDTVRARISLAVELGMLVPGQRLPSPEDTARGFEVSEMTVRRAYRMLSDEGVVVRRPGHAGGTFVADAPSLGTVVEIDAYRADAASQREKRNGARLAWSENMFNSRLCLSCSLFYLQCLVQQDVVHVA